MFSRAQRLSSTEVRTVQKKGVRSFTPYFRMMFLTADDFRVSCIIPKKVIAKRIKRNREKRRILHITRSFSLVNNIIGHRVLSLQKDTTNISTEDLKIQLLKAFTSK
ncbi:MAG: ribonuclease P protein component [Candidatus Paceibacteria bacterium]|jgi:ribonuclease P protein component